MSSALIEQHSFTSPPAVENPGPPRMFDASTASVTTPGCLLAGPARGTVTNVARTWGTSVCSEQVGRVDKFRGEGVISCLSPVIGSERTSTSRLITRNPDEFVEHTLEYHSTSVEDAELLHNLRRRREQSDSGRYTRQPYSRSDHNCDDSDVVFVSPTFQRRPVYEYERGETLDETVLMQKPDRMSRDLADINTGEQQCRSESRTRQLLAEKSSGDVTRRRVPGKLSYTPSKEGSSTNGESISHRSSPFSDTSVVSSVAASIHSALQGAIDLLDTRIADVSHAREKLTKKEKSQYQSKPDREEMSRVLKDRNYLLVNQQVTGCGVGQQSELQQKQHRVSESNGMSDLLYYRDIHADATVLNQQESDHLSSAFKPVISSKHSSVVSLSGRDGKPSVSRGDNSYHSERAPNSSNYFGKMYDDDDDLFVASNVVKVQQQQQQQQKLTVQQQQADSRLQQQILTEQQQRSQVFPVQKQQLLQHPEYRLMDQSLMQQQYSKQMESQRPMLMKQQAVKQQRQQLPVLQQQVREIPEYPGVNCQSVQQPGVMRGYGDMSVASNGNRQHSGKIETFVVPRVTNANVGRSRDAYQHQIYCRDTTPELQEGDRIDKRRVLPHACPPQAVVVNRDMINRCVVPSVVVSRNNEPVIDRNIPVAVHYSGRCQHGELPVEFEAEELRAVQEERQTGAEYTDAGEHKQEAVWRNKSQKPAGVSGDCDAKTTRRKETNKLSYTGEQTHKVNSDKKSVGKRTPVVSKSSRYRDESPSSPDDSDDSSSNDDRKHRGHHSSSEKGKKNPRRAGKADHKKEKLSNKGEKPHGDKQHKKNNATDSDGDDSSADDSDGKKHISGSNREKSKESADCRRNKFQKEIKPNKFRGAGQCVETFVNQFEIAARRNKWSEQEKADQLMCSLIEDAGRLIWSSGKSEDLTYSQLIEKLRRLYGSLDQQEKVEAELSARRRRPGETLAELYQDIKCLMMKAYPNDVTTNMGERVAIEHFLKALKNKKMAEKVRDKEPRDLEAAFRLALRYEARSDADSESNEPEVATRAADVPVPVDSPPTRDGPRARYRGPREEGLARRVAELEHKVTSSNQPAQPVLDPEKEEMRKKLDEMSKELGRLQALQQQRQWSQYKPAESNVNKQQPNQSTQPQRQQQFNSSGQRNTTEVICFNCREVGHIARFCPVPKRQSTPGVQSSVPPAGRAEGPVIGQNGGTSCPGEDVPERKTYLQLYVNNVLRRVLLDTGSDATLLPSFTVFGNNIEPCTQRLMAANGTTIRVNGKVAVEAGYGEHKFQITGLVTNHVSEIMLGIDFLRDHGAVWNFKTGEVQLDNYVHKLCSRRQSNWCRRVILVSDYTVPPRSEVDLSTAVVYNDLGRLKPEKKQYWATEINTLRCGIQVSRTVLPDEDEDVPVRVLNVTQQPVSLKSGTVIANLESVDICDDSNASTVVQDVKGEPLLEEMVSRVDSSVCLEDRQKLMDLLTEFSPVFSRGENDLGRTDIVTHVIDTGDSRPVRQALRRHPPAHQEAIRQHVTSMLEQGVIEPARSPWASNIVLVKKKDGSLRCCIDYRQLNTLTRKDAYPLPRTDVCLDAMSGASWFSTFDVRSAYHQLPMDPKSSDATAFICSEGSYQFKYMPFGLCNAGASYQRLMAIVMSGLTFEACLAYLDDVVVFAPNLEVQFDRLRLVLERLKQAGLKLKTCKCNLLQRSVRFLGHVISAGHISVDPEKVRDVVEWPEPTNVTELRGFIGLCSYYRRFVKDFGKIAAPLNALIEKGRAFEWSPACQAAFDNLKSLLTSAPLLAMPDSHSPLILDTDASNCAIGAVLSQVQDGVEKPIAYASRKLSKPEHNYCVTRKELLAVYYYMKYFRHYLLGRKFVVRTDHSALQWLRKIPEPIGQQARWIGYMEEFDFEVVHRKGRLHSNADALSRLRCQGRDCFCRCRATQDPEKVSGRAENVCTVKRSTGTELPMETRLHCDSLCEIPQDAGETEVPAGVAKGSSGDGEELAGVAILFSSETVVLEAVQNGKENVTESVTVVTEGDVETAVNPDGDGFGVTPAAEHRQCTVSSTRGFLESSPKAVVNELEATGVNGEVSIDVGVSSVCEFCDVVVNCNLGDGDSGAAAEEMDAVEIPGPKARQAVESETSRITDEEVMTNVDGVEVPDVSSSWETDCESDTVEYQELSDVPVAAVVKNSAVPDEPDLIGDMSLEVLADEQKNDPDIREVLQEKKAIKDKPGWDEVAAWSATAKALWQQWDRLEVRNGVLFRRFEFLDCRPSVLQVIVPYKLRRQVFKAVHGGMTGGHMGRTRTMQQLQFRAYWPGWTSDVKQFLKQCSPCAQYHRGKAPKISPLKPFPAGDVWELVSIDITGPHPRSRHGNVYLLTVMDHFTKWADALAISNHTAVTVARVLFNRVFVYRGFPLRLLSDQGPEFESILMSELCRWMEIQKIRTSPYRASTNGMVERYHRSLNTILAKIVRDDQRDWCERVPVAAAAYRASVHEATGYTPNLLTYGKENRAPVDIVFGCPEEEDESRYVSIEEFVASRQIMMRDVYNRVHQHLGVAAERRKERYDVKVRPLGFTVGEWVWYLYPRRRIGVSPKWQRCQS